ncbi:MAG TPA: hypothetical protein VFG35_25105, partial [Actinoplanes sp.]|nr:hypothetical protein [Actinoplanes sp.]
THTVMGPARFTGVWVNNSNIVKALAPGGQPLVGSMVLGRIQRSDVGMKPWNLVSVEGTPDMAKAVELYSALNMGALAWNEPQPLGGGFAAGPGAVTYGQPSAPVNYPGAAAAGWPNATPPAQQTAPQGPPSGFAPPVDPAYAAWQAQQAQAAAIQQAGNAAVAAAFPGAQVIAGHPQTPPPGPAAGSMAVPQGWDPQVWYGLSDQQRAEVLRSLGQ